jgi:hypothetical protein
MTRFILGSVCALWLLSFATANMTTAVQPMSPAVAAEGDEEYQVTKQTIVLLDGKSCQYDDVPDEAEIVLLELAPDGRTIVRIHFESKKS